MSSFTVYDKITIAEAQEWLKVAADSWKAEGFPEGEEEFLEAITDLKPVNFKTPKKPRATKKSSPPSERAAMEYDDTKCGARVWLTGGFAAQCSCKHVEDEFLCKKHQTEADKHDDMVANGFFNAEKPTHKYNDESNEVCWWTDQLEEWAQTKKPKSKKEETKSKRKCSCCGQEGHTKAKCPHKLSEVEAARAVLAAAEEKAVKDAEEKAKVVEEKAEEKAKAAQPNEDLEPEPEEEPEHESEEEEDGKELDTDNSMDCTLDGVYYFRDTEDGVFDDDYDKVGKWNGCEIVFDNEKTHRMAVKQL
jgi:hypothetical protein